MIDKIKLLQLLKNKKINYRIFNPPPLHSVKDSISMRGTIDGAHTKNLFLKNKRDDFFLFSCLESTIIDLKLLKKNLNLGNISFAKANYLKEILHLNPGSVSPFGLLNDNNNKVSFFLDKKLTKYKIINFHPLENTATISINLNNFLNLMYEHKKLVKFINFDNYEIEDGRPNK